MSNKLVMPPYSTAPATRRTVNALLAENAVLRVKGMDFGTIEVPTASKSEAYLEVRDFRQSTHYRQHVEGLDDLVAFSSIAAFKTAARTNIGALKKHVNQLSTALGFGVLSGDYPDGDAIVDTNVLTQANFDDELASASDLNDALKVYRDAMSTIILVFNRLADRFGVRRITDRGMGNSSPDGELSDINIIVGTPTDAAGDFVNYEIAKEQFDAVKRNAAFVAERINGLTSHIASVTVDPETPAAKPTVTTVPAIVGSPIVGNELSINLEGIVATGAPTPTIAVQWNRDGQPVGGATNAAYLLTIADVNKVISATITATNLAGSGSKESNALTILGQKPTNTTPPSLSGDSWVGGQIALDNGVWDAHDLGILLYEVEWKEGGNVIAGETGPALDLSDPAYNGKVITATVRAKSEHSDWADRVTTSNSFTIGSLASITTPAVIKFTAEGAVGDTVVVETAPVATGSPAPTVTGFWRVGGVDQGSYGAVAPYTIKAGDETKEIVLVSRAQNIHGTDGGKLSNVLTVPAADAGEGDGE